MIADRRGTGVCWECEQIWDLMHVIWDKWRERERGAVGKWYLKSLWCSRFQ